MTGAGSLRGLLVVTDSTDRAAVIEDFSTVGAALAAARRRLSEATGPWRAVVDVGELDGAEAQGAGLERAGLERVPVRAAALLGAARDGQILVSGPAVDVWPSARHADDLAGFDLVELGDHRFHGITRPVTVFEVRSPETGPAPPTIRTIDTVAPGLPAPPTPLVGRLAEVADAVAAVRSDRLVTLTGAGGSGKTRLALDVAFAAAATFDGIHWVDLATVAGPDEVLGAVGTALGVHLARSDGLVDRIVYHLRPHRQMLVLDNAEHLVGVVANLCADLVRRCPDLRILVTSREPLGLAGETVRTIPPLSLPADPSPATVGQSDAGAFLVDRLRRVSPTTVLDESTAALMYRICVRLDGIPLAIELAAARARTVVLSELADGLDDRFALLSATRRDALARHRTLDASIRWSFDLSTEEERVVLRRLAVFTGPFRVADALAVAAEGIVGPSAVLTRLVDRSLVVPMADGRLRLLETVRAFAEDRLLDAGEVARVRDRHLEWVIGVVADVEPRFDGPDPQTAVDDVRRLLPDIRVALTHAEATGRPTEMWSILQRVALYFLYQGNLDEALGWFERADRSALEGSGEASADGRVAAALLTTARGDHDEIVAAVEAASTAAQAAGDRRAAGRAMVLAGAHHSWNAPVEGGATIAAGRALCEEHGDRSWSAWGSCGAALALTFLGRPVDALAELAAAEAVASEMRSARLQLDVLARRCIVEHQLGRWGAAAATIRAGRQLAAGFAGISVTACFDVVDAWIVADSGDPVAASDAMGRSIGRYVSEGELQFVPLFVDARCRALLVAGRPDEVVAPLVELRRHPGVEWSAIYRHWLDHTLARALVASGEVDAARTVASRLVDDAGAVGNELDAARGLTVLACIDESEGEIRRAESRAHDALWTLARLGAVPAALDTLRVIARLDAILGRSDRAEAVLSGVEEATARMVAGETPDPAPLVELVRRTRGGRGRPAFGWDGLTPTELTVASLVAEGLTNPEIAQRLVVGRATVKTHVSSALRKLDLAGRTQLATAFRARAADDPGDGP